ncbi:hypothetical protein HMSSN036_01710 [Paenibacillus macerans]|nr:hypothetical protein HMSSN036_01710 [Paenibacillus macerans]
MSNPEAVSLCIIDDIKSVVDGLTAMNWEEQGIRGRRGIEQWGRGA